MGLTALSPLAEAPLVVALASARTPRRAALTGWVASAVACAVGFRFLVEVFTRHGGLPPLAAALAFAAFASVQALRGAGLGLLTFAGRQAGLPLPLSFVVATPLAESLPVLIEWSSAAAAVDLPLVPQVADLGGAPLVALALASASAAAASPLLDRLAGRRPSARASLALATPFALALVYGALRAPSIEASARRAPALPVGIVPGPKTLALSEADTAPTLARQIDGHRALEARGARLIVWSEAALPFPVGSTQLAEGVLAQLGGPPRAATVVGAVVEDEGPAGIRSFYNAALSVEGRQITGRRDKQELLPFGEYVPLEGLLPFLRSLSPASGRFRPGPALGPLFVGNGRVAASICYEDVLAGLVNESASESVLLVNLTNDAWFEGSDEPEIHLAHARLRAIEQRRYLVRATSGGISAVVDPLGRVTLRQGPESDEPLFGEARLLDDPTIFSRVARLGLWPWAAAALACWLGARLGRVRNLLRHARARGGRGRYATPRRDDQGRPRQCQNGAGNFAGARFLLTCHAIAGANPLSND